MATKSRRAFVVDASVLRAAGTSAHPTSSACGELLMQVLHVCHHAAFNASLVKEWECHGSHFSMTWRAAMTSRGKMVDLKIWIPVWKRPSRRSPENCIHWLVRTIHLVALAIARGQCVVSLDGKARGAFRQASSTDKRLEDVMWVDPVNISDAMRPWLAAGAPRRQPFLLSSASDPPRRPSRRTPDGNSRRPGSPGAARAGVR